MPPADPSRGGGQGDFLEQTRFFHGKSNITPGDTHAHHTGGLTFNALGITTTVRNHMLNNVVLDADALFLFQDRQAIPETAYSSRPTRLGTFRTTSFTPRTPQRRSGAANGHSQITNYRRWSRKSCFRHSGVERCGLWD